MIRAVYGDEVGLWAIAIDSGERRLVGEDGGDDLMTNRLLALAADRRGATAVYESGGLSVLGLDATGDIEWQHDLAWFWRSSSIVAWLDDGRVLFFPIATVSGSQGGVHLPLLLDPAAGTWSVPDGECGTAFGGGAWLPWGDDLITVKRDAPEDSGALWLGTLTVSP